MARINTDQTALLQRGERINGFAFGGWGGWDSTALYPIPNAYAQLVTSLGDTQTKQGEIRRMIATTSNEAYDFLLSFLLSHAPDADVAELDMIAGEVSLCFNQYAGIELQAKDGAESIVQIPGRMEIARDGGLEFSLCCLAMADLYFKGGIFRLRSCGTGGPRWPITWPRSPSILARRFGTASMRWRKPAARKKPRSKYDGGDATTDY